MRIPSVVHNLDKFYLGIFEGGGGGGAVEEPEPSFSVVEEAFELLSVPEEKSNASRT